MRWSEFFFSTFFGAALAFSGFAAGTAHAQRDFSDVEIKSEHVKGNIHVLFGAGGNIGVLTTDEGLILIDDQFAPLTDRIEKAVASLGSGPVKFVLNTHWHGDHTGGNENLGKGGAVIVAHDNVHKRLAALEGDRAVSHHGLPDLTFNDHLTFHLGEEARAYHIAHAHTDGDSFIHFMGSNVIHMGDLLFVDRYPFIDIESGGSLDGMIEGLETALALTDAETKIIGGHGPLTDRAGLERSISMLKQARERVGAMIADGKSLDEIIAARPMAAYDETWGWNFIGPDRFLTSVYESLSR